MGIIDKHTVDKIYNAVDIVDVVSDYVELKRAGSNYKGLCPFHNEKTPSFMVSPAKGIYKCFGCGASGQAVKFVMEQDGLSYPEALKQLAKKYNIDVVEEEVTSEAIEARKESESLQVVTEFAEKFFADSLHNTSEGKAVAMSYFKERGISKESINTFRLGWSPEARDAFTKHALKNGYKIDVLSKAGLTIDKETYRFDRFAARIIFPIHSVSGKVVGFGGRTLKNDKKTAKYLNSPESDIYHKSKVLYGIYQAKNAILKTKKCYVAEGYTDVISLAQNGIENVVSSSGTALTSEQVKLIRRFSENICLIFDSDPAGIKASLRGIDLILQEEMNVKVVVLPTGEDPDSFAQKHGGSKTTEYFETNEQDFISFKTSLLKENAGNDPVERARNISSIVHSISVIPNIVLRNEYVKQCSRDLGVDESVLYEELEKRLRKKNEDNKKQAYREKQARTPAITETITGVYSESNEKEILRYLLLEGIDKLPFYEDADTESVAAFIIREMKNSNLEFRNLVYKSIFADFDEFIQRDSYPDEQYFLRHDDEKVRNLAAEIFAPQKELSIIWEKQGDKQILTSRERAVNVVHAIEKYKLKIVQLQLETVDKEISDLPPDYSEEAAMQLIEKKQQLDEFKKSLTELTQKSALL